MNVLVIAVILLNGQSTPQINVTNLGLVEPSKIETMCDMSAALLSGTIDPSVGTITIYCGTEYVSK